MNRKKVLVHGTFDSLQEFLNSPFNNEYETLALISQDFGEISTVLPHGGGWNFSVQKI